MNPTDQQAAKRMSRVRQRLLAEQFWYGSLALRFQVEETRAINTMSTDGTHLRYNPDYVMRKQEIHLMGTYAEEVYHAALGHPWRVGNRSLKLANRAADEVARRALVAAGFEIDPELNWQPDSRCTDQMSFEQVYSIFASDEPDDQGDPGAPGDEPGDEPGGFTRPPEPQPKGDEPGDEQGDGAGNPDPNGQPRPGAGDGPQGDEDELMTAADWQVAAEEAAYRARKAGAMPGDLSRALKANREPSQDWRAELREFVQQNVPTDRAWTAPDRRFAHSGLYLPGVVREDAPRMAEAIDGSGSITAAMLDAAAPETLAILYEVKPESLEILYHDTRVTKVQIATPDDTELILECRAGGGTNFQCVIDHLAENPPACLVWFTDLEVSEFPPEPDYPVLWITPASVDTIAPYGRTIRLDPYA